MLIPPVGTSSTEGNFTLTEVPKTDVKISRVIIPIFLVLAAGGALTLIALSGGPRNLLFFAPGAALFGVDVIAFIAFIAYSLKQPPPPVLEEQEEDPLKEEEKKTPVTTPIQTPRKKSTPPTPLSIKTKKEVVFADLELAKQLEHLEKHKGSAARDLGTLDPTKFQELLNGLNEKDFEKFVPALVANFNKLKECDVSALIPAFAAALLKHIDVDNEFAKALMDIAIDKVVVEWKKLPKALARTMITYLGEVRFPNILEAMDATQKTAFLNELAANKTKPNAPKLVVHTLMTIKQTHNEELLKAMAHWPVQIAQTVGLSFPLKCQVYDKMDKAQRKDMVDKMCYDTRTMTLSEKAHTLVFHVVAEEYEADFIKEHLSEALIVRVLAHWKAQQVVSFIHGADKGKVGYKGFVALLNALLQRIDEDPLPEKVKKLCRLFYKTEFTNALNTTDTLYNFALYHHKKMIDETKLERFIEIVSAVE